MKGIMFKEPLFLKVVAGEKTQTRRIIKDLPPEYELVGMGVTGYTVWQHPNKDYTFGAYPRYKDEIIYLKEPYISFSGSDLLPCYKYGMEIIPKFEKNCWKNKLFMAEKFARYFIKITNIRVQRVNDITEADAIAEGLKSIAEFHNIWITIHGFSSLKENPWVYCYTFELINK